MVMSKIHDFLRGFNMEKRRKGFSLVEVLAGAALLFIIGLAFSTTLAKQFAAVKKTETITKDAFSTVKRTEQEIQLLKDSINKGDTIDTSRYESMNVTLFSDSYKRTVSFYKIENGIKEYKGNIHETGGEIEENDNVAPNKIITYVSAEKEEEFPTVQIEDVTITYHAEDGITSNKIAQVGRFDREYISGDHTTPKPLSLALQANYQWYVSREGYYKLYNENPTEGEVGKMQPRYKADYTPIKGETSIDLKELKPEYRERFLILEVRAATTDGKISGVKASNPIYVSGIHRDKYESSDYIHFDASLCNTDNSKIVTANNKKYLTEWEEIYNTEEISAIAADVSEAPQLITEKRSADFIFTDPESMTGEGISKEVYYDFLRFDGTQKLKAQFIQRLLGTQSSKITMVLRTPKYYSYDNIPFYITNGTDYESHNGTVSYANTNGTSKDILYDEYYVNNATGNPLRAEIPVPIPGEWNIVEIGCNYYGEYEIKFNGYVVTKRGTLAEAVFMTDLIFGECKNANGLRSTFFDIAEFIYRSDAPSSIEDYNNYQYLARKYNVVQKYAVPPIAE